MKEIQIEIFHCKVDVQEFGLEFLPIQLPFKVILRVELAVRRGHLVQMKRTCVRGIGSSGEQAHSIGSHLKFLPQDLKDTKLWQKLRRRDWQN